MLKTYTATMPDGTVLTRKSTKQFYFVAAVKTEGEPWGWVRWSSSFDGADRAIVGWIRSGGALKLEQTYVGTCTEVTE